MLLMKGPFILGESLFRTWKKACEQKKAALSYKRFAASFFTCTGKKVKSPASTFVIETKVAKILGLSYKMLGKCSAY